MGSGKTSVGRVLAARLGWDHVDLDQALERRWGRNVARQFAQEGEAVFRAREAVLLAKFCRPGQRVLSTGGGVVLRAGNRARLKRCTCVYLQASPQSLAGRLKGSQALKRPLLRGQEPRIALQKLSKQRGTLYRSCASLTVQAAIGGPQEVAERILDRLKLLS